MGDIDPMGKEIGHGAAAKVPKPAPAVELFFAKGLVGSVAEPLLPIERLDFDGVVFAPRQLVLPPIGADLGNAAEAAALNQIHGIAEMAPTALLHAALQDSDRKSTRLNSSHGYISYAVFCLKKKNNN